MTLSLMISAPTAVRLYCPSLPPSSSSPGLVEVDPLKVWLLECDEHELLLIVWTGQTGQVVLMPRESIAGDGSGVNLREDDTWMIRISCEMLRLKVS
uniref:Uncharacterized protein n=1 Tax=Oryza sativa subsp. japonica TaxID=39947 RepID=Q2QMJ0_ORYSJ|nr:hypothetical protein LOC_Os12g40990 [Oryza sativa Japonica Group]